MRENLTLVTFMGFIASPRNTTSCNAYAEACAHATIRRGLDPHGPFPKPRAAADPHLDRRSWEQHTLVHLRVSPQHRVLVRSKTAQRMFGTDEVLVAAKQLVLLDGIDIAEDVESAEYFHILFDRHEVVISNGAETTSLRPPGAQVGLQGGPAGDLRALSAASGPGPCCSGARVLASGRIGRKLAMRHARHGTARVH